MRWCDVFTGWLVRFACSLFMLVRHREKLLFASGNFIEGKTTSESCLTASASERALAERRGAIEGFRCDRRCNMCVCVCVWVALWPNNRIKRWLRNTQTWKRIGDGIDERRSPKKKYKIGVFGAWWQTHIIQFPTNRKCGKNSPGGCWLCAAMHTHIHTQWLNFINIFVFALCVCYLHSVWEE